MHCIYVCFVQPVYWCIYTLECINKFCIVYLYLIKWEEVKRPLELEGRKLPKVTKILI